MFSKKLQTAPAVATASSGGGALLDGLKTAFSNPYVGAGSAGLLLLLALAGLVAALADPMAGAPSFRAKISEAAAGLLSADAGFEPVVADSGQGQVLLDGQPIGDTIAPTTGGEVIIQLPGATAHGRGLPTAPIAGFAGPGPGGSLLPVITADGRTPAQAYARPFKANGKPRVALMMGGLGINPVTTRQAIEKLPPEVTLSFVHTEGLQPWIDLARAHGHEVLLEVPMEPVEYPANDPGPNTLMVGARPEDTIRRTELVLSKAVGYFGVTNYLGSRFIASDTAMDAFLGVLRRRGLAFIDDGPAAKRGGGIPRATARVIDISPSPEDIARQLAILEGQARQSGQAVGAGFVYPVTINQVIAWSRGLEERGFQLAPASALAVKR